MDRFPSRLYGFEGYLTIDVQAEPGKLLLEDDTVLSVYAKESKDSVRGVPTAWCHVPAGSYVVQVSMTGRSVLGVAAEDYKGDRKYLLLSSAQL